MEIKIAVAKEADWIWFAGIAVVIGVLGKMGADTDDKNEESAQAEERNEAEDKNENE